MDGARLLRTVMPVSLAALLLLPTSFTPHVDAATRVALHCCCQLGAAWMCAVAVFYLIVDPITSSPQIRYVKTRRPPKLPNRPVGMDYDLFLSQCAAHRTFDCLPLP